MTIRPTPHEIIAAALAEEFDGDPDSIYPLADAILAALAAAGHLPPAPERPGRGDRL